MCQYFSLISTYCCIPHTSRRSRWGLEDQKAFQRKAHGISLFGDNGPTAFSVSGQVSHWRQEFEKAQAQREEFRRFQGPHCASSHVFERALAVASSKIRFAYAIPTKKEGTQPPNHGKNSNSSLQLIGGSTLNAIYL